MRTPPPPIWLEIITLTIQPNHVSKLQVNSKFSKQQVHPQQGPSLQVNLEVENHKLKIKLPVRCVNVTKDGEESERMFANEYGSEFKWVLWRGKKSLHLHDCPNTLQHLPDSSRYRLCTQAASHSSSMHDWTWRQRGKCSLGGNKFWHSCLWWRILKRNLEIKGSTKVSFMVLQALSVCYILI